MSLDLSKLSRLQEKAGKTTAACPACAENGGDTNGNHLAIWPDGRFGCAVHPQNKEHRKRIFALAGVKNGANHKTKTPSKVKILVAYDYTDENGDLLFQVVRMEPKSFRQRHKVDGEWIWKMDGVRRVLYRLPEVSKATDVFICEGEKDCDNLAALGFAATTNPGGAGKWRDEYSEALRGKHVVLLPDNDEPGRKHVEQVARALHGVAASVKILALADLPEKGDVSDWLAKFEDKTAAAEQLSVLAEGAAILEAAPMPSAKSVRNDGKPFDALRAALASKLPMVRLPGQDYLLSACAAELAKHLRSKNIFVRNGEVVALIDGDLRLLLPQTFRSWCESHVIGYREKTFNEAVFTIAQTMRNDEALGILASPQFIGGLRRIKRLNTARLPVFREDGTLELLPNGFDEKTHTLTLGGIEYDLNMPLAEAVETIGGVFEEFCFADNGRSKSVAASAMVGLFVVGLLPQGVLRPAFIFIGNAEGAGKSLLTSCCITPVTGRAVCGSKPADDAEMSKLLLAAVREGKQTLVLDNLKGMLSSPPLEGFISASVWNGRILGVNQTFTGENQVTVFITGNGMKTSPDMRRRSLFVALHLSVEKAEDRIFKHRLDDSMLLQMRPRVLGALWAMVKAWDKKGRPEPSRSHSAFPAWASVIGGIVQAAGFGCCLETAEIKNAIDQDGEDMRQIVAAMADRLMDFSFDDLIGLARELNCFENFLPTGDKDLKPSERSRLGWLFSRYDGRLIGRHLFQVDGKGHSKRFRVVMP